MFKFTVSTAGTYNIGVRRTQYSGLDADFNLYNSSEALIASRMGDPNQTPLTLTHDGFVSMNLASGTYYLRVGSHGNSGDIGQYQVTVSTGNSGWIISDYGMVAAVGNTTYSNNEIFT